MAEAFSVQLSEAGQRGLDQLPGPARAALGQWLAGAAREPARVAGPGGPSCLRLPGCWAIYEVDAALQRIAIWDVGPGSPAVGPGA